MQSKTFFKTAVVIAAFFLTVLPAVAGSLSGARQCSPDGILAAEIPEQPSRWEAEGLVGIEAGQAMCAAAAPGSHVCSFEEVILADASGELVEFLPEGSSAWLYRTTPVVVDGKLSMPGSGATCLDYTYNTAHLGQGEVVNNNTGGGITYELDPDTKVDLKDRTGSHINSADMHCGGAFRSILCCYRICEGK